MKTKLSFCLSLFVSLFTLSQAHAASVTVNSTADALGGGTCSLRNAIRSVNANAVQGGCVASGGGTIDTVTLPAGTYLLGFGMDTEDEGEAADGDLDVDANLTLNGAGSATTIITYADNVGKERIFEILSEITVNFNGVTITGGEENTDGGGVLIKSLSVANFNDVQVNENTAQVGGGIFNEGGLLTLTDCTVNGNIANGGAGGGIQNLGGCDEILRIKNDNFPDGGLMIQNSTISGNQSFENGGGINNFGTLVMDSSTVSNNETELSGGGIAGDDNFGCANALITNSTINNNDALGTFEDVSFSTKNGIFVFGQGGGIFNPPSPLTLVNSTVSGNTAASDGGGITLQEFGCPPPPAIKEGNIQTVEAHFFNATIADNTATEGSGGGVVALTTCDDNIKLGGTPVSFAEFANTLIANNEAAAAGPDCSGAYTSLGYNLIGDDVDCNGFTGPGDQTDVPAGLGPLANNGGPTQTHALQEGSNAIDTGDPEGCLDQNGDVLDRDQRGEDRPVNATEKPEAICDIGAFEVQVEEPPQPNPPPPGQPVFISGACIASLWTGPVPHSVLAFWFTGPFLMISLFVSKRIFKNHK